MENAAQKIKDWWEVADRTQKFVTIFGASALALMLVLTAYVMSKPRMAPLYSGLSPEDQGKIVTELRKNGIPVEFGQRGTVMVPSTQVEEAESIVASAGVVPSDGPQGMSLLFNESPLGQTSKQEEERTTAAKEGEIAKTIMTWQGVASAKVHWNKGDQSPFMNEKEASSATVNIVESGQGLSGSAGKAIARLVQNATGVDQEHITVSNNFGRLLFDGDLINQDGSTAGQKLAAEIQEARRREGDLARSLDMAFGPGNTIAMIQVELDMDTKTISSDTETPSEMPVIETSSSESVAGAPVAGAGGPTGFGSNNPASAPDSSGGAQPKSGTYDSSQKGVQRAVDRKHEVTNKAQGTVISMTVQVLANKKNVKDIKSVQQIADAYLGSKSGQEGFTASVTPVEFDTAAVDAQKKAAGAVTSNEKMQQILSILPVIALFIVGFMVVKAITKAAASRSGTTMMQALPQGGMMQMPHYPAAPIGGAVANQRDQSVEMFPSPQGQAGKALVSAMESGKIDDILRIIEEAPEDPEIKAIQARINVPLEQIKHMAKTKPESVAMLLKGWMMEDMR